MNGRMCGLIVALLALPAVADDKPEKKPPTPAEQFQAIQKEFDAEKRAFQKALNEAKSPEAAQKVFEEKQPRAERYAPQMLELAEKNPKDPIAIQALSFVLSNGSRFKGDDVKLRTRAAAQVVRDHLESKELESLCPALVNGFDESTTELLRAIHTKSPHASVRAKACQAMAQHLSHKIMLAGRLNEADLADRIKAIFGEAALESLRKADVPKMQAECAKLYQEIAEVHAAGMGSMELTQLVQTLGFRSDAGSRMLVRSLADKDKRVEVRGVATLTLAQMLRREAEEGAVKDPKEVEKLLKEAEAAYEVAMAKYADVKTPFRGSVGDRAKTELFALRNLAVGKKAPDVEAPDQDGKTFKLSDYQGKVVLLDFWSEY